MSATDRRFQTKWWGWGDVAHRYDLSHAAAGMAYLRQRLGLDQLQPAFAHAPEEVALPASRADAPLLAALGAIVGGDDCRVDHHERLFHSAGKGYQDLLRLRALKLDAAVDAVVYPESEQEVAALLALGRRERVAVIPFGGGTSVVSGLEPLTGACRAVIALDLTRMNRVLEVDTTSLTATVDGGIYGPDLEAQLRQRGLMLGHFPQSFEFSTLGGWLATRSSGQNCLRYGGIEKLVESLRVVTPSGTIETLRVPRRGDGPDVTQMLVGSEGTLGVIVSATVRLRPAPEEQDYFMVAFKTFRAGLDASRAILRAEAPVAILRVSDEEETMASLALGQTESHGVEALKRRFGKALLKRRGYYPPNLAMLLVGIEGTRDQNRAARGVVRRVLRGCEHFDLGRSAGQRWLATRFELPYLRDELMDNHLLIDTLETATTWSGLERLYQEVREGVARAAAEQGQPMVVYCHASHLYPDGASLYFTLLGRQHPGDPLGQWRAVKTAANEAIRRCGAVISHHHGVGLDHREHAGRSPAEQAMLAGLKSALDPDGVMNPGKLL